MLFLGPLYKLLADHLAMRINHFALIKLTLMAIDKTILYFLIFAILRLIWLLAVRHRRTIKSEMSVWLLAFYIILILMLTTFRNTYFPWQLNFNFHRPLSDVNLVFMKETWKLLYAQSRVDFIYNCFGNILCFLPLGFLSPIVFSKKQTFWRIIIGGMLFSMLIETLQFLLGTGVSDIDDVFFNTIGMFIGYLLYQLSKRIKNKF
ncbi:VanZ family protein [Lactobacillus hamsteri]|uniref:Glycopeptide antibiotics resistance protein n=1 Tax=Lactobacillus hamsteri DSM 5661 = JCM 6256 TaxID=1423754 RepID=A0A0R1Y4X1_9LACO|nr:VanZ family protein [Lactobacillus hamsteri]KRM37274.1 glycopeptide antibiotics resistance protein [Lactobacillus hamsteri DSM 5661 = JCM 6256]